MKERLTGAAVIVMLAVIFIPMILDGSGQDTFKITETNIPARPDMEYRAPASPAPVERGQARVPEQSSIETVPRGDNVPEAAADAPAELAADAPEALPQENGDDAAPGAWVVQLGSFSSSENAKGLVRRLQAAGYPAYIEELESSGGTIYRVRIGPEIVKAEADRLLESLAKKLELKGILLRYP